MEEFREKIQFELIDTSKMDIELVVTRDKSEIVHLLKNPYDGGIREYIISGNELKFYINGWKSCFQKFEVYKEKMKYVRDGSLKILDKHGLIIYVGQNTGYIALINFGIDYFKIYNQDQLNEVISKYKYIRAKIIEVQKIIKYSKSC